MPPALLHSETFRVRFFECEPSGITSPASMCRYAQEAADRHCRTFGLSLLQLRGENRMWVLTRFRLQMDRYPQVGDSITVETWASSRTNGIRAIREFRFLDADGAKLGHAYSIWLMLDSAKRRPVRLPQVVLDIRNDQLSDPVEFEIPRLKPPENPTALKTFQVGWRDLDSNNHANNVNYVEWALETLPLVNRQSSLVQFDIEFLGEALYADHIVSVSDLGGRCGGVHRLTTDKGKLLALAVSKVKSTEKLK